MHLLSESGRCVVHECVNAAGNRALVGEVPGDTALVPQLSPANEGGVEDKAVLGCVSLGF